MGSDAMKKNSPLFAVLDPRKVKRGRIECLLTGIFPLKFRRFPPLGLFSYPETQARVEQAFVASRGVPEGFLLRMLKRTLLRMQYNGSRAFFERHPKAVSVVWNGLNGSRCVFAEAARDAGNHGLWFELCPFPERVTVDPAGVNFLNALPRAAAPYLEWFQNNQDRPDEVQGLREKITQREPKKPLDTERSELPDGKYIFVPLQTPGDSQLRVFGGAFTTIESFTQAICEAADVLPAGWHIRLKEHPTAEVKLDESLLKKSERVFLSNHLDTFEQVRNSALVMTVNSSVGLEAMFFDKPVVVCGDCFWAIDGISVQAPDRLALSKIISNPDAVQFDADNRRAFLNYLLSEYYPQVDGSEESKRKIEKRMESSGQMTKIKGQL